MFHDFFYRQVPGLINRVVSDLPDEVTFSFIVTGDDGGEWQVSRRGPLVNISETDDTPKDCTMICRDVVLQQILDRTLDPKRAFFDGRLRLEGDVGLALRLQKTLVA